MKINIKNLSNFMSPYLNQEFKQDRFEFTSIDISDDKKNLIALVDLTDHALSSDGNFHLSAITNARIAGQLAIIYIFYCLGIPKNREIWQVTDNWEFKKPITKLTDIKYDIKNISLFEKSLGSFYNFSITVEDKSFMGKASYLKPK
ncbi:hypothetical protein AYM02_03360 [Coxiella burnetii]|uniref:Uncharacterized protein n=2 Tax=Coxiella burnetii TaxID=777 RepID=Q83B12_COXBU|nr:hypothetical protein [Coxiella burnetii]NP_820691.1 hypothetical protein CBU_1710 [Coxiella burnetii RSA 493]AAO91205.1 hypothetical protein CBU_1710 [Coxiella burnetii RSA 493]ABS77968.1 hypothetical protein CBUD_0296 [Coxiella burnetii Dugway 5J108-111]AML48388.1 hypothetical protein AUR58_03755 [Coxiella burnetii]AML54395.1 hypothetical protein AYM38_03320 [Coxiella burnetii]ARI66469.1 hypothetical protein B7L74_08795 [Coxiella burnetii]